MKKLILIIALIFSSWVLSVWADNKTPLKSDPDLVKGFVQSPTAATAIQLPWSSLNGGGDVTMSSTNYKAKVTTAQSVIGVSQSTNYQMGIGFWYGPGIYCLGKPGDASANNALGLNDVIGIVNYAFNKPGFPPCAPNNKICWLAGLLCRGDWNGDGNVTLSDAIRGVNYVFNKPNGPWNPLPSGVCCVPVP